MSMQRQTRASPNNSKPVFSSIKRIGDYPMSATVSDKAPCHSSISDISVTHDIGRYLGVHLLHGRVIKQHFNPLIEKVQRHLTG